MDDLPCIHERGSLCCTPADFDSRAQSSFLQPKLPSKQKFQIAKEKIGSVAKAARQSVLRFRGNETDCRPNGCTPLFVSSNLHGSHLTTANGLLYKVPTASSRVVRKAWESAGFKKTTGDDWDVLWGSGLSGRELRHLSAHQKVNHFPGSAALGRKDTLAKNLQMFQQRISSQTFDFHPSTFLLPRFLIFLWTLPHSLDFLNSGMR